MGRRVAVSSMGTRLFLLYLLEGWLASRLALAAENEKPGETDVVKPDKAFYRGMTPSERLQPADRHSFDCKMDHLLEIDCDTHFIHVIHAVWYGLCKKSVNHTKTIKQLCENKHKCEFVPFWREDSSDSRVVNLGSPCRFSLHLSGIMECRDPCIGMNCHGGSCVGTAYDNYICDCNPGYINRENVKSFPCVKNRCEPNPCGHGTCELTAHNSSYTCHCPTGQKFLSGTCVAYDMCEDSPSPCPKGAICSDGYGKLPKCTCPEFHTEQEGSCVAIDTCDNLECPPEAVCVDGVGKQGTCQCLKKYHEIKDGKCEPVDQCLIDHGGCDPKAFCTDGVGKPATCRCPKDYKLEKEKCVFVNSCLTDNGGCHQNASCEHKEGEEVKCTCKEGFIGDGQACHGPHFPDNAAIELILRGAAGRIFYHLGRCLSVIADPKTNHYSVTSADREPQTHTGSSQQSETMEGGTFKIVLQRSHDVMEVLIIAFPKGSTKPWPPTFIQSPWDDSCDIDEIAVQDDRGPQTDVDLYMTEDIFAARRL